MRPEYVQIEIRNLDGNAAETLTVYDSACIANYGNVIPWAGAGGVCAAISTDASDPDTGLVVRVWSPGSDPQNPSFPSTSMRPIYTFDGFGGTYTQFHADSVQIRAKVFAVHPG